MAKIIRTKDEIEALMGAMDKGLVTLPDYNIFGESNAESKAETRQWIDELQIALDEGRVEDEWGEVGYWLVNDKSQLAIDYEVA